MHVPDYCDAVSYFRTSEVAHAIKSNRLSQHRAREAVAHAVRPFLHSIALRNQRRKAVTMCERKCGGLTDTRELSADDASTRTNARSSAGNKSGSAAAGQAALSQLHALGTQLWAEIPSDSVSTGQLCQFVSNDDAGGDEPCDVLLPPVENKQLRRAQFALLRSHFPTVSVFPQERRLLLQRTLPPKLVAVDLDNTLWPGVLLEGSLSHQQPAATAKATATLAADWTTHQLLQAELVRLQALGVLLVSLSRNDEAPVLAAWPPPPVCPLQPAHFVCHRFGWGPKSHRLVALARDIAFPSGLDHRAIIFIDGPRAKRCPRARI